MNKIISRIIKKSSIVKQNGNEYLDKNYNEIMNNLSKENSYNKNLKQQALKILLEKIKNDFGNICYFYRSDGVRDNAQICSKKYMEQIFNQNKLEYENDLESNYNEGQYNSFNDYIKYLDHYNVLNKINLQSLKNELFVINFSFV